MSRVRGRLVGAGVGLIGAGALALAIAAPAGADVTDIEITTPSGYGSSAGVYGTGCEYEVQATVDDYSESAPVVTFVSKKEGDPTSIPFGSVTPDTETVSATWEPTSPGTYEIGAAQDGVAVWTEKITVGEGFVPIPSIGGSADSFLPFAGTCFILP
ncbi:hypothetical protein GIY30_07805 [Gordonia sp. HNM0687]|uniref:Ig-like domain repeat protein n=1 Tax=Gordonia mangrovi TaxID=2665643 RepID=A0A6L7GPF5_9ACTN|nr:hypothetical protein [Gordonia mangrovi]MXP21257.1 hypothetical protein [Gordonia mangrovi]UVF78216.1 hypothetical protein NWF22_23885 [Gordonia mangrovi]